MKTLIAVAGCHERQAQADAQRQTWVKDVQGADVRFFAGWPPMFTVAPRFADDVWLDCPDGYVERKEKILALVVWALDHGYEYLWKTDDDVYLRPERLLALPSVDYQGLVINDVIAGQEMEVCHGFLYGLSRLSMVKLLEMDEHPKHRHEDIWVGQQLSSFGIVPVHLGGLGGYIRITHKKGVPNNWPNQEYPTPANKVVASFEYTPEQLVEIHSAFNKCAVRDEVVSRRPDPSSLLTVDHRAP